MSNGMGGFSTATNRSTSASDRWLQKSSINNYSFYDHIPMATTASSINYSNKLLNSNHSPLTPTQLSAMQNGNLKKFNIVTTILFLKFTFCVCQ